MYNGDVKPQKEVLPLLDITLLGTRIRELRKQKGLTQEAFARELHVSFQAVSNWERGIAPPELETLFRIASFFHVLVDDLLRPSPERLLLGVDGGGTKTELVVTSMDGRVLSRYIKKGSNPNDIGFDKMYALLCEGINDALIAHPSLSAVSLGIAGISSATYTERLTSQLKGKYPSLLFEVRSDSANLFGMDDGADIAVISGTGSVVFVKSGEDYHRLGGWGHLFDSAGSAYDIGRDAVCLALREEDERRAPGAIARHLTERLETPTVWGAINRLYDGGKPFIASLADVVFRAYDEGDADAAAILDRTARRLAELLNLAVSQYGARPRAVAGGGILEHRADVLLPLLSRYSKVEVALTGLPPVFGACRSAHRLTGSEPPADFYTNFKESLGGTPT